MRPMDDRRRHAGGAQPRNVERRGLRQSRAPRWLRAKPLRPESTHIASAALATAVRRRSAPAATVTGRPGDETPEMQSPIFRLVANPTWTVPESIAEEEITPKGEAYLRNNNRERRDGRIVQQPGPKNSLGQVKFDMRNDHAIYLHDTPAKTLFASDQRQLSHGCVRVQDALGFARMIAEQEGVLET